MMQHSVGRAFAVLEALVGAAQPMRLMDLADTLKLGTPSVHRTLGVLIALGYAEQDASTSRYSATLKLHEIARRMLPEDNLHLATVEPMRELRRQTGESVAIGSYDQGCMVFVGRVEGPSAIRAEAPLGSRFPATATAIGKAILAWRGPESIDEAMVLAKRFTRLTLTTRQQVMRELEAVRRDGFAVDRGEYHEGVAGIASAVRNASNEVVAAICVWGAADRILGDRFDLLARLVVGSAAEASRRLGASVASGALASKASKASPARSKRRAPARATLPTVRSQARKAAKARRAGVAPATRKSQRQ